MSTYTAFYVFKNAFVRSGTPVVYLPSGVPGEYSTSLSCNLVVYLPSGVPGVISHAAFLQVMGPEPYSA